MKRPHSPTLLPILVSTLSLWLAPAHAVELLRWERLPLAVPLVVGQERVIFVDRNVRIGVPPEDSDRLRVQSAGGAIYLRASQRMAATRLQLQDVESGALILLDVTAEAPKAGQPALEPVRIVESDSSPVRYGESSGIAKSSLLSTDSSGDESDKARDPSARGRETPVAVVLTRYAAQNLYAPLRTVEPVAGVGQVNLRHDLPLDTLMPTLPVRTRALAAWRLEDQWVTAVQLTNTTAHGLELDPRTLQGDFVAATFQHSSLGPAGQSTDTTVVYLVTRGHGLADSLLPRVSRIDITPNLTPAGTAGATGTISATGSTHVPQGDGDEK